MRIVFMGTPGFAIPALETLVHHGHEVVAVYTQPPRPAGRGKQDRPSPIHQRARELSLAVKHPLSFRDDATRAEFAALAPDVAVVAAYGLILPQTILDAPTHGCLNIHASLLPRWRGAAPINRAIMAGDRQSGICIMQMEAGLDTGPVLLAHPTPIGADETASDLHDRLAQMGAEAIAEVLGSLASLNPTLQPRAGVTYADKLQKSETRVNWNRPAREVDCFIRGLSATPGAWTEISGERVKLLRSRLSDVAARGAPGEVMEGFTIACADGCVSVTEVQRAGKKPMAADVALQGFTLPARLS